MSSASSRAMSPSVRTPSTSTAQRGRMSASAGLLSHDGGPQRARRERSPRSSSPVPAASAAAAKLAHPRHRASRGRLLRGAPSRPSAPPDFATMRTSSITTARSTPLIMSTTARAVTETAVRASISTPVRSAVPTVASMRTPSSTMSSSTLARCTPITCASGSSEGRGLGRLDAGDARHGEHVALRHGAVARAAITSVLQRTKPRAVAVRTVGCFAVTSTMCARPAGVKVGKAHPTSMTSITSPTATVSTSAGTIANACARASPPARWDPDPPAVAGRTVRAARVDHGRQVLATSRGRRPRCVGGERRTRAVDQGTPLHREQGGAHENLERHRHAHGVPRQAEHQAPVIEHSEGLRLARLHGDRAELDLSAAVEGPAHRARRPPRSPRR